MAEPALDWLHGEIGDLRARYETERARAVPPDTGWRTIGTVRVLEHRLPTPSDAAIIYFHGGGFIVGSPLTHVDITAALSRRAGLPLFSVDYRLAPEHVAPAPIEDGRAVVEGLLEEGSRDLILCGDSAGAAIALALEASLPAVLRRQVRGICAFYGAYGQFETETLRRLGKRADGTDAACVRRYFSLATGGQAVNPYAIGALARPSPVPVFLLAGGDDPLRDDTSVLAAALTTLGRSVTSLVVHDAGHGFLHGAERSAKASRALDAAARQIRQWCGKGHAS